jgi:hypothetical protein
MSLLVAVVAAQLAAAGLYPQHVVTACAGSRIALKNHQK